MHKKPFDRSFPAEWHPQSGVLFTFPHADSDWAADLDAVTSNFVDIVNTVTHYEKAVVVCDDTDRVAELLQKAVPENLLLIDCPSNDTWARDHSAITVLEGNNPVMLDFMFNGWGLKFPADKDNLITGRLHAAGVFGDITLEKTGLVLEGGALESDGQGTLLTTSACLLSPNRNPHLSKDELAASLGAILGSQRILWLDHGYLEGDDTDSHIDTLARFCDPETIAYVRCDDENDVHYDALKAMENQLRTFRTNDDKPYHLVPLPMATAVYNVDGDRLPATYANFLIINGAVLLPVYGDVVKDQLAVKAIQSCFPDRVVHPINCSALILQHGSLHCVTMQVPAEVALNIYH